MKQLEGKTLEHRYKVETLLNRGGMGAVYRCYDTKLKIPVAIKSNFFHSPESINQFEQEALLLARLRHPNLPRVFDHFSFEGEQYLVMDFIEGDDLWKIVSEQGYPLTETQALDYICQICEAVSYLHKQNPPIIHRDIKPQNIKITPTGEAILVDFGIAKVEQKNVHTNTAARGVTPGFSPPEQYSGSGTTVTSDIYALGATLYAILTAKQPPDSIKLITGEETFEFTKLSQDEVSPELTAVIQHAMQIRPTNRPQSVAQWRDELMAIRPTIGPSRSVARPQSQPVDEGQTISPIPQTGTDDIEEGRTISLAGGDTVSNRATNDDHTIASPVSTGHRPPDSDFEAKTTPLPYGADTIPPAASPSPPANSHPTTSSPVWLWPAVVALIVILLAGGIFFYLSLPANTNNRLDTEAMLASLAATMEARATEGHTETEIDYEATIIALQVIGTEQAKSAVNQGAEINTQATIEAAIAATTQALPTPEPTDPATDSPPELATPEATSPVANDFQPATGRIAFQSNRDGNLEIYRMTAEGDQLTNLTNHPADDTNPAWSPDGQRLAFTSSRDGNANGLYLMNDDGAGVTSVLNDANHPAWAPDNQRLAFWTVGGGIQLVNINGEGLISLTQGFPGGHPTWSPNGQQLIFDAEFGGANDLFLINADGSGETNLTTSTDFHEVEPAWSPDGQRLAFTSGPPGDGRTTIYVMNVDGSNVVGLAYLARQPVWSPDGSQIAFASNRDGNWEIYVMNADGSEQTNITNHAADDMYPAWGTN